MGKDHPRSRWNSIGNMLSSYTEEVYWGISPLWNSSGAALTTRLWESSLSLATTPAWTPRVTSAWTSCRISGCPVAHQDHPAIHLSLLGESDIHSPLNTQAAELKKTTHRFVVPARNLLKAGQSQEPWPPSLSPCIVFMFSLDCLSLPSFLYRTL